MTVPAREFVEIWQQSASIAEVVERMGCSKNAARVRALRYREQGVPLKEFPPAELPVIDWQELAEYAAGLVAANGGSD